MKESTVQNPSLFQSTQLLFARLLVVALSAFYFFPSFLYLPIVKGPDSHWQVALHYFFENNFQFGKDVVFTYGPLGILHSRMAFASSSSIIIAWDLISYGLIMLATVLACWQLRSLQSLALIGLMAVSTRSYLGPLDAPLLLFALYAFYTFAWLKTRNPVWGSIAAILSIVTFFTKLSIVFGLLIIQSAVFAEALWNSRKKAPVVLAVCSWLAALLALSLYLNVSIPGYLLGGLSYVSSYSDAMYHRVHANKEELTMALTVGVFLAVAVLRNLMLILKSFREMIIVACTLGFFVVLFKQAFVRGDWFHKLQYFQYTPYALGIALVYSNRSLARSLTPAVLCALLFCFSFKKMPYNYQEVFARSHFIKAYLKEASTERTSKMPAIGAFSVPVPKQMEERIGNASVDIFPFQLYQLILLGYNYQPRPVPQSYAAYNEYLDTLNATHFGSEQAPEFVLFTYGALDLRYVFFDEPKTRLALLQHYDVVLHDSIWILLQRRAEPRVVHRARIEGISSASIGEPIAPPESDELVYLTAHCDYSILGKLMKALYKAPPLNVRTTLVDGLSGVHRVIKPLLDGGVLYSPFVANLHESVHFFQANPQALRKTRDMSFETPWNWGFRGSCELSWEEVALE